MRHHCGLIVQGSVALGVELAPCHQLPAEIWVSLFKHIHCDGLAIIPRTQSYQAQRLHQPVTLQLELRQGEHIGLLLRQPASCWI